MNTSVTSQFHSIIASGNYKTRLRIYSIPESVDCTDDADVVANGTLLVANVGDTDSNARIAQGGVTLNDYFNKDVDVEIGQTVSCQMSMTLMNNDGALDNYDYGKFKAYLDVTTPSGTTWQAASLGVFYFDIPTKRRVQLVSVTARDQMQKLDAIATDWFDSLDFTEGLTLQEILNSLVAAVGVTADTNTSTNLVNGSHSYTTAPFDAAELTYRDILAWIAGAAGGIARFDRNGFLTIRYFQYAFVGTPEAGSAIVGYAVVGQAKVGKQSNAYYNFSTNTLGNGIFNIDIAEYSVSQINKLVVKSADEDFGTIVGLGTNAYELVSNPFMEGETSADIIGRAQNVYNVISALDVYKPITIDALTDWSIEAGDIIYVYNGTESLVLPIFQQQIVWNGVSVKASMSSSGNSERPVNSKQNRMEYRQGRSIHQLEITAERLLSMIQTTDGNYSEILQRFDSITSVVSALNDSLTAAQSQITQLADSVEIGFTETSTEFMDLYSFIRLIASGIVIGKSTSDIKLKLENDVLYFFTGDETSVTTDNAIAYFSTNRLYVNNSTIRNITLGTESQALDIRIMGTGDNICAFFGGRIS